MTVNPLTTIRTVKSRYLQYLKTTFNITDPVIRAQFEDSLIEHPLIKGPIVEATPPFIKGNSVRRLAEEGVLSNRFLDLLTDALPVDRPLYLHQEQAIRRAVAGKNLVVATGTGSGKTEIFMITMLNGLFREMDAGSIRPGVRALLLYPMNALVNDQLKRMRSLLANEPRITFGRFTGETPKKEGEARRTYRDINKGEEPLPNELISREAMRVAPPHILLTNYAMLEYLLLRPEDTIFFDGEFSDHWRYLVLDEAHTYTGAKGIEMAMLLRRLKERVLPIGEGLQCIATSATLGSDETISEVVDFASRLFDEPFDKGDVIRAKREDTIPEGRWKVADPGFYNEILCAYEGREPLPTLIGIASRYGVPIHLLDGYVSAAEGDRNAFIYHLLHNDTRVTGVRRSLLDGPRPFKEMANDLFPENREALVSLINLAGQVHSSPADGPLLSARYHTFIRTVEGAYIQFLPEIHIYLEPTVKVKVNDHLYPVFEFGVCRFCGKPFLLGKVDKDTSVLQQNIPSQNSEDTPTRYFLIASSPLSFSETDEIDDPLGNKTIKGEPYLLCARCGSIRRVSRVEPVCSCGKECQIELIEVISNDGDTLHTCPGCARTSPGNSVISRFMLGKDSIPAVLSTALFQELSDKVQIPELPSIETSNDDPWAPVVRSPTEGIIPEIPAHYLPGQLLVFSDSRQDAAYFAPYLNGSYDKILRRSLIVTVLAKNAERIKLHRWSLEDMIHPLRVLVEEHKILNTVSSEEKDRLISRWLMYEFIQSGTVGSLASLGLLSFQLKKPEDWNPPSPLSEPPFNLSQNESWILFQILLDNFRRQGAIQYLEGTDPTDEFFSPRNRQLGFLSTRCTNNPRIMGWEPKPGRRNARLDYLVRLFGDEQEAAARDLLHNVWKHFIEKPSPFNEYKRLISFSTSENAYIFTTNAWELVSSLSSDDVPWYACDRCGHVTTLNIHNVCPTYRCSGTLCPIDPHQHRSDNHYRLLYENFKAVSMHAQEHTAQLTNRAASDLQQKFLDRKVNVLSCSTTFELGVDVGELEVVFMRNMPPTAANYIQRAGRAGRRTDSTAFVVTFCQRRSHDLSFFNDPMPFVQGVIKPPHFELRNEKIIRRHIYATALAAFWRIAPETFKNVEDFFLNPKPNGPDAFRCFLEEHPDRLHQSLKRIVPDTMQDKVGIGDWTFIKDLFEDRPDHPQGLITRAEVEVRDDVESLEQLRTERFESGMKSDQLGYLISNIKKRPIISFLSAHNVIPKYGFPVDIVELQVMYPSAVTQQIELQRDLKIALSEYAPGSQVVAAGKVWRSRYVKRHPKRGWLRYRYVICPKCHRYHRDLAEKDPNWVLCEACEGDLTKAKNRGEFIIPEFGFQTDNNQPAEVGEARPDKTYSTRVFFSGEECPFEITKTFPISPKIWVTAKAAVQGKLAVINRGHGGGFNICTSCGYTILAGEKTPKEHKTATGRSCSGRYDNAVSLGHEYLTDILILRFEGCQNPREEFWLSLMYALLNGISQTLGINRDDIDGCLYPVKCQGNEPALVLFDTVPGGAGHVKRAIEKDNTFGTILSSVRKALKTCTCGAGQGHASCYGCLRTYQNQFCHEQLDRQIVIEFLEGLDLD